MTKPEHLLGAFEAIRCAVLKSGKESYEPTQNAKGDWTQWFDKRAEEALQAYWKKNREESLLLLSEECGEQTIGEGSPKLCWIVDPVDGSENFARSLNPSGVAIGELPYGRPLHSNRLTQALIGTLDDGRAYLARPGEGTRTAMGERVQTQPTHRLSEALIGCDFNFKGTEADARVLKLMKHCKDLRRLGSTVSELMCVADGRYDGYVDLRGVLTAEDFLAASLVIREAGGVITDELGNDWGEITDFRKGHTVVAAANEELHGELIRLLNL